MKLNHLCEMCLAPLGLTAARREKDLRKVHAKLMARHAAACPLWNNKVAQVLRL